MRHDFLIDALAIASARTRPRIERQGTRSRHRNRPRRVAARRVALYDRTAANVVKIGPRNGRFYPKRSRRIFHTGLYPRLTYHAKRSRERHGPRRGCLKCGRGRGRVKNKTSVTASFARNEDRGRNRQTDREAIETRLQLIYGGAWNAKAATRTPTPSGIQCV